MRIDTLADGGFVTKRRAAIFALALMSWPTFAGFTAMSDAAESPPWLAITKAAAPPAFEVTRDGSSLLVRARGSAGIAGATVAVGAKGTFLDEAEYERAKAGTNEDERRRDFPDIGARAMISGIAFGPGGSSITLVSTTKDERYDLSVSVVDDGSSTAQETLDPFEFTQALHDRYDDATKPR